MTLPRRLAFANRHFELDRAGVLDIGYSDGHYLAHFGPGSVGIDVQQQAVERARARGLDARRVDITNGLPPDLRSAFDAVWCSNILEHVLRPHEFLLEIRRVLRPGGVLVAVVPLTRRLPAGPWRGFLAADHVNFFTPRTLRLTVERAGYRVDFLGWGVGARAPRWLARAPVPVAPNAVVVARPVPDFQYPPKAHKLLDVEGRIVFKQ